MRLINSLQFWIRSLFLAAIFQSSPANAQLAVSQLIVELRPGLSRTADIEIFNDSPEPSYVAIEPREIVNAGSSEAVERRSPDPEELGFLVSPARMILDPGERKIMRIGAIGPELNLERVYRVTVKPVTGSVAGDTGLKLLVGYDILVLVRPVNLRKDIELVRDGRILVVANRGNASVELADVRQCNEQGVDCRVLPGKRLYAGTSWRQTLPHTTPATLRVRTADGWSTLEK